MLHITAFASLGTSQTLQVTTFAGLGMLQMLQITPYAGLGKCFKCCKSICWSWNISNAASYSICWFWNVSSAVNYSVCWSWNELNAASYGICCVWDISNAVHVNDSVCCSGKAFTCCNYLQRMLVLERPKAVVHHNNYGIRWSWNASQAVTYSVCRSWNIAISTNFNVC